MKTLQDFNLKNKRVLVRCDFNVPLDDRGNILDDYRIKKAIPTIEYLINKEAKVILMTHLGRPKGKVLEELSLTPVQNKLTEYLDLSVTKAKDCIGSEIEKWTRAMQNGEILLLENLRFHKQEEENNRDFAKQISKLGDIYVNEAFSVCHRAHASVVGVAEFLPAAIGFCLEREIKVLGDLMENPQKPLVAVIGGKKVDDKAAVIGRISKTADFVLVNGLIEKAIKQKNLKFDYPNKIIGPVDELGQGKDIGPKTLKLFQEKISCAKTVFWSGPLGAVEEKEFSSGSQGIAEAIVESKAFSAVGGGDTVEFVTRMGFADKFSHLSLGGGAMLEFLSGKELPGLKVLEK